MTNTAISSQTMVTKHGDLVVSGNQKILEFPTHYLGVYFCSSGSLLGYNVVTSPCGAQFSVHMSEISMIEITYSIKRSQHSKINVSLFLSRCKTHFSGEQST